MQRVRITGSLWMYELRSWSESLQRSDPDEREGERVWIHDASEAEWLVRGWLAEDPSLAARLGSLIALEEPWQGSAIRDEGLSARVARMLARGSLQLLRWLEERTSLEVDEVEDETSEAQESAPVAAFDFVIDEEIGPFEGLLLECEDEPPERFSLATEQTPHETFALALEHEPAGTLALDSDMDPSGTLALDARHKAEHRDPA